MLLYNLCHRCVVNHLVCVPASSHSHLSRTSRTLCVSPSSLASHSLNAVGVLPVAANEFCAASPPASPSFLALLALAPEIAEHFAKVESLGRASYWRGEIGQADSGIKQATGAGAGMCCKGAGCTPVGNRAGEGICRLQLCIVVWSVSKQREGQGK